MTDESPTDKVMADNTNNNNSNGNGNDNGKASATKRRRNRKKKNKSKHAETQKEEERQKELEFSRMNNHGKLRKDLMEQGFSAKQIDAAMDEMWNQNMPYDEYEQVYKYLKENGGNGNGSGSGKKKKKSELNKKKMIAEKEDDDGVEESKEVDAADLTPSQVIQKPPSPSKKQPSSNGKSSNNKPKTSLNSMAARLDLVAGFDNLADAIFAMTEWIIKAAKPNDVSIN